ncbi:HAD family hydrolase [Sphingobium sp.]|uniref:HAD family hydrolase n=1 Tax=Sphingobium sp. TaxID=1912891 RepID=UPI003B3A4188
MTIKLICLDADDTLWHNMRHFHETEDALFDMLRPFAAADVTRERMIACEIRNLPLYGYGAKGFTLSMIETAVEVAGDRLDAEMIKGILAAGRALLAHPVLLFDGVKDTLERLADSAPLVLVTKGDLLHQESKLAASGLGDLFSGIEIVSDKKAETFRTLFARMNIAPQEAVMAGDSMRSDILPALEAGAWAAFIPQEGAWVHESAAAPSDHPCFTQLERLADLPDWIGAIG